MLTYHIPHTWSRLLQFQIVSGLADPEDMLRRTLSFSYYDRANEYDYIEWELNNRDGYLTRPDVLVVGFLVMVQFGYTEMPSPWRAFIINRVQGGVGVRTDGGDTPPIGEKDGVVKFFGRNRNAPGGRPPKPNRGRKVQPPASKPKKPRPVYGPTSDVTANELILTTTPHPGFVPGTSTADVVERIAWRNGFRGPYALVQPTDDLIEGLTVPPGIPDGEFLRQLADSFGYIMRVDDSVLHWHAPTWEGAKHVVAAEYNYGADGKILSLDIDCDFRLPVIKSVDVQGYDRRMRRGVTGTADTTIASGSGGFVITYIDVMNSSRAGPALQRDHVAPTLARTGSKAEKKALARFINSHVRAYTMNMKVVGDPDVLATRLVSIRGTGSPFVDGLKYVKQAVHTFRGDDYVTELQLTHPPKTAGPGPGGIERGVTRGSHQVDVKYIEGRKTPKQKAAAAKPQISQYTPAQEHNRLTRK